MKNLNSPAVARLVCAAVLALAGVPAARALDHPGLTGPLTSPGRYTLIEDNRPAVILADTLNDDSAVTIALRNLSQDFGRVCGTPAPISDSAASGPVVIAGTLGTPMMDRIVKSGKIKEGDLKGKTEKYIMATVADPMPGVGEALVIAGSDRRGTVYGIYELSEQIGVSPWYDWADVPVVPQATLSIARGEYTAGEPAVRYRGIFLNDEAPCLTGWVKNTYGTDYGDHNFYARVFELLLRLRGNFMWPAMWGWAFYADDPENSATADRMGVMMGTSHHEPMARNHQEWARHRNEYGKWNYRDNRKVIDGFFAEGIRRARDTEDVVTIGMRGDGDEAMGDKTDIQLMEEIISNQRRIIKRETGRAPEKTPQIWALYKEVLDYYDAGMKVPDDVTLLLCDDNWGNVRRVPSEAERNRKGGWGMYYHVDYVGAPRNSKLLNVTPAVNMWEQLDLTYRSGIDRLWILNVGDLKPMEYPITMFLDMAWNPSRFTADNVRDHAAGFCTGIFGEEQGPEAARLLLELGRLNGRCTPEMLDRNTYSLEAGEWDRVCAEYSDLERRALRQYISLAPQYRDAYHELILFPAQLMANLHEMYRAQAMNHKLHAAGDPEANVWADRVAEAFARDGELMDSYNNDIAGGKWNGMMRQKHIGYTSWNDAFKEDTMPETRRVESSVPGGHVFTPAGGYAAIEAMHYNNCTQPAGEGSWTTLQGMGRTGGGMAVMPYTESTDGAVISYAVQLPAEVPDSIDVLAVVKSNLAFKNKEGHCFEIGFEWEDPIVVNYNHNLNEEPRNIYTVFYPTIARRVVENKARLKVPVAAKGGRAMLTVKPLDPGIVFEKFVLDLGGYPGGYLHGAESPHIVER